MSKHQAQARPATVPMGPQQTRDLAAAEQEFLRARSKDTAAVDPSLTVAHFTARELDIIRKACRDSDFEDAGRLLAAAIKRGDGR